MLNLKRSYSNKGYLLLESVASIAVIAIGLAIILRSFTSSLRASKISQEYLIASSLLKDKMWELEEKAKRDEGGLDEADSKEEDIPNAPYKLQIAIEKYKDYSLANVRAMISWDNGNRHETIEANTFMRYKK